MVHCSVVFVNGMQCPIVSTGADLQFGSFSAWVPCGVQTVDGSNLDHTYDTSPKDVNVR